MGAHHRLSSLVLGATLLTARAASAQVPADPIPGLPRVHIESATPDVLLLKVPSESERAQLGPAYRDRGIPVCRAPCDKVVDARDGSAFLVDAGGATGLSDEFSLRRRSADVAVKVGSRSQRDAGIALTVTGATMTTVGPFIILGYLFAEVPLDVIWGLSHSRTHSDPYRGMLIGGGIMTGLGPILCGSGIALLVSSRKPVDIVDKPRVRLGDSAWLEPGVLRF
jgi:hypothetical protein